MKKRETFGALLAAHRQRREWSGMLLAKRAGLTESAVSRLERGERMPTRQTVEQFARALDLAPGDQAALLVAAGFVPRSGVVVIVDGQLLALTGGVTLPAPVSFPARLPRQGSCAVCHDATRPIKARGLCSRHYRVSWEAQRHAPTAWTEEPAPVVVNEGVA